jgi:hypothetical protein
MKTLDTNSLTIDLSEEEKKKKIWTILKDED